MKPKAFADEQSQRCDVGERHLKRLSRPFEKEREKWVVYVFMQCLGVEFAIHELRAETEESNPVDIHFREAAFQIKEHLDKGRQRTREYRESLKEISAAESERDIIEHLTRAGYEPEYHDINDLAGGLLSYLDDLSGKYASSSKMTTDLLIYVNLKALWGVIGESVDLVDCREWRSISLTIGGCSAVLAASDGAPVIIRESAGLVRRTDRPLPRVDEFCGVEKDVV